MRIAWHDNLSRSDRLKDSDIFARGAMVARQVLTLKIEVRVLAGEPILSIYIPHSVVDIERSVAGARSSLAGLSQS